MDEIAVFEDYEIEGLPRTEANLKWLWERFQCTQCGQCCEIHKTGVRISKEEATEFARRENQSPEEFLKGIRQSGDSFIMPQPCRYHRNDSCAVQDAKPFVCREYPMHFRNTRERDVSWVIITACPGGRKLLELLLTGRQEGLEYSVY
jgi:Fe-S-cluster containining protein